MKKLNKLFALALAIILTLSLCTGVFAADGYRTAVLTDHTYTAYQIFSGTQADDDTTELGNIEWGDGIDDEGFLEDLQDSDAFGDPNIFAECETAKDVAEAIAKANKGNSQLWADDSDEAKAFAKLAEDNVVEAKGIAVVDGQTQLDPGYYLVVDTTETVPVDDDADDVYNLALLQLTKKETFDINVKVEVPEVIKQVSDIDGLTCTNKEANHVHGKDCYNWADSNDVALGDTVSYNITTAVPATAPDYDYYFFIIRDILSEGLTLNEDSFVVTIIDGEDETVAKEGEDYTLLTDDDADPYTFQIALIDAISNAGKTIDVYYTAEVNEKAIVGVEGNPNTVDVKFSNKPDHEYDYEPDDEEEPGFPKEENPDVFGETPEDYTVSYTTQIKLFKVDQDTQPLTGATFTLSGDQLNKTLIVKDEFVEAAEGTTGAYWKLLDGTYTKTAPTTEVTYREATEEDGRDSGFVQENGGYREATTAELEGDTPLWIKVNPTASQYDDVTKTYNRTTTLVESTQTATGDPLSVVGAVDEFGIVQFTGLDEGTYTLTETVTPDGYNTIAPFTFTIECTLPDSVESIEEECVWTVASDAQNSGIAYVAADNAFEVTIENQKGSTLPETGGVGTTIFYVIGGVLLVGAAALLITKKRMGVED